ncbi:hypothetical protein, partial [Streptomyces mirabilis]
ATRPDSNYAPASSGSDTSDHSIDHNSTQALVALQKIADGAGVIPALVSGAPVPADVLDQTELRENRAEAIVDFWKDADVRDPAALARMRSIDLDGGLLLGRARSAERRGRHATC